MASQPPGGAAVPFGSGEHVGAPTMSPTDVKHMADRCIRACPDYLAPSAEKYNTIFEMFGEEMQSLAESERKLAMDEIFVIGVFDLTCRDSAGNWALHRHPLHVDRRTAESTADRKDSVSNVGILQGYREPPMYTEAQTDPAHSNLLHQATLLADGCRAPWDDPTTRRLRTVQIAVATPIRSAKKLHKNTCPVALQWYMQYFNIGNTSVTKTTFIQEWTMTREARLGFARMRNQLSHDGGGASSSDSRQVANHRDLTFANSIHNGIWGDKWQVYEVAKSFYMHAPLSVINSNIYGDVIREANQNAILVMQPRDAMPTFTERYIMYSKPFDGPTHSGSK